MFKCSFGGLEQHTLVSALETAKVLSREAVNVSQRFLKPFLKPEESATPSPIWGWLLVEFRGFGRDLRWVWFWWFSF